MATANDSAPSTPAPSESDCTSHGHRIPQSMDGRMDEEFFGVLFEDDLISTQKNLVNYITEYGIAPYDTILYCYDGSQPIPVHGRVLSAFCPYFFQMFTSQKSFLHGFAKSYILDIEGVLCCNIIHYLYYGHIYICPSNVFSLLRIARGLELWRLVSKCEEVLRRGMKKENCHFLLMHAKLNRMHYIESDIKVFMKRNKIDAINIPFSNGSAQNFADFTYDQILQFLASRPTSTNEEEEKWAFTKILEWAGMDPNNRAKYVRYLLTTIKLARLPSSYLMAQFRMNPLLAGDKNCQEVYLRTMETLVSNLEERDEYTFGSNDNGENTSTLCELLSDSGDEIDVVNNFEDAEVYPTPFNEHHLDSEVKPKTSIASTLISTHRHNTRRKFIPSHRHNRKNKIKREKPCNSATSSLFFEQSGNVINGNNIPGNVVTDSSGNVVNSLSEIVINGVAGNNTIHDMSGNAFDSLSLIKPKRQKTKNKTRIKNRTIPSAFIPNEQFEVFNDVPALPLMVFSTGTKARKNVFYAYNFQVILIDRMASVYGVPFQACLAINNQQCHVLTETVSRRFQSSFTMKGNIILDIGGHSPQGSSTKMEYFDTTGVLAPAPLVQKGWKTGPHMKVPRTDFALVTFDDFIYVLGGVNILISANPLIHVERLELSPDGRRLSKWNVMSPMLVGRRSFGAAVLNNHIFVVGGIGDHQEELSTAAKYNIDLNTWTEIASMSQRRKNARVTVLNNRLYAVGGCCGTDDTPLKTCEVYDPEMNLWTYCADMAVHRNTPGVVSHGEKLYAFGGNNETFSAERYDPLLNTWELFKIPEAMRSVNFHCVTLYHNQ